MEDLKQHYLDEMLSLSNDLGIKDHRNEKIDIRFERECEDKIDELKGKFNEMNPDDFLIMGNKDLNTIPEKESNEFIKSSVEDLDPIPSESEALPYKDSDPLLKENDILLSHFDNSSPEYETFSFDIKEKNSSSTTTHSDYSLSDYEVFYFDDDHIEEKSSGSTTTHSDFFLPEYDSFIFDLSIDPFPHADRSVSHHDEFADELTHIISSQEYDYFYFVTETDSGELTILSEETISKDSTKEFTSLELNDFPLLLSDCDFTFSEEFSETDLLVSFPFRNKDKVFNPEIFIIKRVQSKNEDKVFDPGIFFINGVLQEELHIF
nr:hypothetical protein [Tanacetum cinerariifolium]